MLSVLIPTYNYNVTPLVKSLDDQLQKLDVAYEIICFDNGSNSILNKKNEEINKIPFCRFEALENDIGRSKIRNMLADNAKYEWLLFLDTDVLPVSDEFITNYLSCVYKNQKVVYGGLKYEDKRPSEDKLLRWIYGKSREEIPIEERDMNPSEHFASSNFMIRKDIFNTYRFDKDLTKYGHEDTLLGLELKRNKIELVQIDNPVYHLGLDLNEEFLQKTRAAVDNLCKLQAEGKITKGDSRLLKRFSDLKKFKGRKLLAFVYRNAAKSMERNLLSSRPSLYIFDLYRLGYLCDITSN